MVTTAMARPFRCGIPHVGRAGWPCHVTARDFGCVLVLTTSGTRASGTTPAASRHWVGVFPDCDRDKWARDVNQIAPAARPTLPHAAFPTVPRKTCPPTPPPPLPSRRQPTCPAAPPPHPPPHPRLADSTNLDAPLTPSPPPLPRRQPTCPGAPPLHRRQYRS